MKISATHPGLSSHEAKKRLATYGGNTIVQEKKYSAFVEFFLKFKNPLIIVLFGASLISGFLGDWTSAIIIISMVFLSVGLDFFNTHKAARAAEALRKQVLITATVLRDGRAQELHLEYVVPGDIVLLTPGDIVPADGVLVEVKDFFTDESTLTGESFPVQKNKADEVWMGCSAITGAATMAVVTTGRSTKFSKIAEVLEQRDEQTEFDREMSAFSFLIMKMTFILIIFVFFINAFFKHAIFDSFLFSVALAVGLTPELLPMIIALNLSKGALALSKHGVIVKKLSAIQNLGAMDILCTDKTGTLTEGKIRLARYIDATGAENESVLLHAYLSSIFLRVDGRSPLDVAVCDFKKLHVQEYRKIDEIPFDYTRKRSSLIVAHKGTQLLISKGAPEEILKICSSVSSHAGALTAAHIRKYTAMYRALNADGFRVLGVATRAFASSKKSYEKDDEKDLMFLGFVSFYDPPKHAIKHILLQLEQRGIEMKILTGDNDLVTRKVADEVGIPVKGVITGAEMEKMSDTALQLRASDATIFSRLLPDQKRRVISLLQRNNHVVGYLGDGINDAPPLRQADVGISVNNATDVAKGSADIILLYKSLEVLVNGAIAGRKIFSNTLKYLKMALSSNFGNMFSMAGASMFLPFLPMLPVQILLNNLLYDMSQFTIPFDAVDDDETRAPKKMDMRAVKRFMITFGLTSSVFDFITFAFLYLTMSAGSFTFQTGWFLESLMTQVLVVYVIRTKKIPFIQSRPSLPLVVSTLTMVGIGFFVAQSSLGAYFSFLPLNASIVTGIACIVTAYLGVTEIMKRVFHRNFI